MKSLGFASSRLLRSHHPPATSDLTHHPPPLLPLFRRENGFQSLVGLLADFTDAGFRLPAYFDHPDARLFHDLFHLRLLFRCEIEAVDNLLILVTPSSYAALVVVDIQDQRARQKTEQEYEQDAGADLPFAFTVVFHPSLQPPDRKDS